jgi:hypothetical protein
VRLVVHNDDYKNLGPRTRSQYALTPVRRQAVRNFRRV